MAAIITIIDGLAFVSVVLHANNRQIHIDNVLLDTGSGGSVFRTHDLEDIGVMLERSDQLRFLTGIGGQEPVIEKRIDRIEVGNLSLSPYTIELGAVQYGYNIRGVLGMAFLLHVGATINFRDLTLS